MGFSVNANLSAMNACRYLKTNDNSYAKAVQRLSSGLRINTAADDPAGLVTSERFRAQMTDLDQSIRNAQDSLNLVQTAENSLEEVTKVLRQMRNLALHAANTGANNPDVLAADQEQIQKAIATIDRISSTTSFGSRRLLAGSGQVTDYINDKYRRDTDVSSSSDQIQFLSADYKKTKLGFYDINVISPGKQGVYSSSQRPSLAKQMNTTFNLGGGKFADTPLTAQGTIRFNGYLFDLQNVDVDIASGDSLNQIAEKIQQKFDQIGRSYIKVSYVSKGGNSYQMQFDYGNMLVNNDGNVVMMTVRPGSSGNLTTYANPTNTGSYGTFDSSLMLGKDETVTVTDGSGSTLQVLMRRGETLGSLIDQLNGALKNAGFKITASIDVANRTIRVSNDEYGNKNKVKYKIQGTFNSSNHGLGLYSNTGACYIAEGGNHNSYGTNGKDIEGTINGESATGDGQYLYGRTGTDAEGLKLKITAASAIRGNILLSDTLKVSGSNPAIQFTSIDPNTKMGTHNINITNPGVAGVLVSSDYRNGVSTVSGISYASGIYDSAQIIEAEGTVTLSGALFDNKTINIGISYLTFDQIVEAIQTELSNQDLGDIGVSLGANGGGYYLQFNFNRLGSNNTSGVAYGDFRISVTNSGGIELLNEKLGYDETCYYATEMTVDENTKLSVSESLIFKDGSGGSVQVDLSAGTTAQNAVMQMNNALRNAGYDVIASLEYGCFMLTNNNKGDSDTVRYSVQSNNSEAQASLGLPGTDYFISDGGAYGATGLGVDGEDLTGTIDGVAATLDGEYLIGAAGTDAEGLKVRVLADAPTSGSIDLSQGDPTILQYYHPLDLDFQLGARENQRVSFSLDNLSSKTLGDETESTTTMNDINLASIDLIAENGAGAQDAIKVIDAAIAEVSSARASLGAFQKNVLETSIRSMGLASQNLSSSESVIRDSDLAHEMLSLSKAQILKNTAMAMVAQANQSAFNLLRLFR